MAPYIYITLPTFMVFVFIGGVSSLLYVFFRIEKFGLIFSDFLLSSVFFAIGAYFGAAVLFAIIQLSRMVDDFSSSRLIELISVGGIVFYGGLFGVLITVRVFAKLRRYDKTALYQMIAPAIPLFHGFGRIGCFMAGCCYGVELSAPIKIFGLSLNRLPTQLIEAAFCFTLFCSLVFIEKSRDEWDSLRFYLLTYAIFRFAIEFFRGDDIRGGWILSTSQWISLGIVAYYLIKTIKAKQHNVELKHGLIQM